MTHQMVRTAGHELRIGLGRHRGSPVSTNVHARPDREGQTDCEQEQSERGAQRNERVAHVSEGAHVHQDHHDDEERHADA